MLTDLCRLQLGVEVSDLAFAEVDLASDLSRHHRFHACCRVRHTDHDGTMFAGCHRLVRTADISASSFRIWIGARYARGANSCAVRIEAYPRVMEKTLRCMLCNVVLPEVSSAIGKQVGLLAAAAFGLDERRSLADRIAIGLLLFGVGHAVDSALESATRPICKGCATTQSAQPHRVPTYRLPRYGRSPNAW